MDAQVIAGVHCAGHLVDYRDFQPLMDRRFREVMHTSPGAIQISPEWPSGAAHGCTASIALCPAAGVVERRNVAKALSLDPPGWGIPLIHVGTLLIEQSRVSSYHSSVPGWIGAPPRWMEAGSASLQGDGDPKRVSRTICLTH